MAPFQHLIIVVLLNRVQFLFSRSMSRISLFFFFSFRVAFLFRCSRFVCLCVLADQKNQTKFNNKLTVNFRSVEKKNTKHET